MLRCISTGGAAMNTMYGMNSDVFIDFAAWHATKYVIGKISSPQHEKEAGCRVGEGWAPATINYQPQIVHVNSGPQGADRG